MNLTNETGISLPLAVMFATDEYQHNPDPNTISVTGLLKSTKQVILSSQIPDTDTADISTMIASRLGTAIHTCLEDSWKNHYKQSMTDLGYPARVIDKIVINPETVTEDMYPIYLENRTQKKVGNWTVSGMYDMIIEDAIHDLKTTSTFTYVKKSNDKKYMQQLSIYRWLNQDKVKSDTGHIQFIFTDWSAIKAKTDPKYPSNKALEYKLNLMSVAETEQFISNKLMLLDTHRNSSQDALPPCSPEDRWESPSVWKYYKNPSKLARSTKNFDNQSDALIRLGEDSNVGTVIGVKGVSKGCEYCAANSICNQYKSILLK